MTSTQSSKIEKTTLILEGDLNIYLAAELKQSLLTAIQETKALEVDLSNVTELDTAAVQILILTKQVAQARQCELHLVAHSTAVLEVFDLLNLIPYFGDAVLMHNPTARNSNDS